MVTTRDIGTTDTEVVADLGTRKSSIDSSGDEDVASDIDRDIVQHPTRLSVDRLEGRVSRDE